MSRRTLLILLGALLPLVFAAGWFAGRGKAPAGSGGRTVLYYVDPMNPGFRSAEPGTAPCGMALEPVYADGQASAAGGSTSPNAVRVSAEREQLVGVARAPVKALKLQQTLRLLGPSPPTRPASAAFRGRQRAGSAR